jgi:Rrf2 family iron-sulfur cluster assembly transcriptional regulator
MIHSTATKYAIRAVCYLAELPAGTWVQAREISESLQIPYHYLSKILHDLAQKRLLASSKGPGGGFRLNCSPAETSLYTVVEALEGPIGDDECMLGLEICSDDTTCPMHEMWGQFRAAFRERMAAISLTDVVEAARRKREAALVQLGTADSA